MRRRWRQPATQVANAGPCPRFSRIHLLAFDGIGTCRRRRFPGADQRIQLCACGVELACFRPKVGGQFDAVVSHICSDLPAVEKVHKVRRGLQGRVGKRIPS